MKEKTNEFDGVIKIDTSGNDLRELEDDYQRILKLPPDDEGRKYALKYFLEKMSLVNEYVIPAVFDRFVNAFASLQDYFPILNKLKNPHYPKTEEGRQNWRRAYKFMVKLDKEYALELDNRKPRDKEYADALATKGMFGYNGKPYNPRTLREIRRAAGDGILK